MEPKPCWEAPPGPVKPLSKDTVSIDRVRYASERHYANPDKVQLRVRFAVNAKSTLAREAQVWASLRCGEVTDEQSYLGGELHRVRAGESMALSFHAFSQNPIDEPERCSLELFSTTRGRKGEALATFCLDDGKGKAGDC